MVVTRGGWSREEEVAAGQAGSGEAREACRGRGVPLVSYNITIASFSSEVELAASTSKKRNIHCCGFCRYT